MHHACNPHLTRVTVKVPGVRRRRGFPVPGGRAGEGPGHLCDLQDTEATNLGPSAVAVPGRCTVNAADTNTIIM